MIACFTDPISSTENSLLPNRHLITGGRSPRTTATRLSEFPHFGDMSSRWFRAVVLCALLVVAGCAAPAGEAPVASAPTTDVSRTNATTTTPSAGDAPEHVVVDGDLPVDANRTFDRVAGLLDADYAPTSVIVEDLSSQQTASFDGVPFFSVFGVTDPGGAGTGPAGLTTLDATVYLSPAAADSARVEQVLAHEFVHVAQVREDMVPWFGGLAPPPASVDEQFVRRALVEGAAVYATDAYTRANQLTTGLQSAEMASAYADAGAAGRFLFGQYYFGFQYANATLDDPAAIPALYEDPPATSEQVLHPESEDAPLGLDVTVNTESFDRVRSQTSRAGEFLTRVVLRQTTRRSTAREAAAGWGTDDVVAFDTPNGSSVAWVTRWDTASDADEFAAAARTLDDRPGDVAYRTERLTDDTVVVFAGTEQFVATAEASGNVTIAA